MSLLLQHLKETADYRFQYHPAYCAKCVCRTRGVARPGGRLSSSGRRQRANASHAVNDFRKIAGIECYPAPTTSPNSPPAPTIDGWSSVFVGLSPRSKLNGKDALLILLRRRRQSLERTSSPASAPPSSSPRQFGARFLASWARTGYTARRPTPAQSSPPSQPEQRLPRTPRPFCRRLAICGSSHSDSRVNQNQVGRAARKK